MRDALGARLLARQQDVTTNLLKRCFPGETTLVQLFVCCKCMSPVDFIIKEIKQHSPCKASACISKGHVSTDVSTRVLLHRHYCFNERLG